jgi:class 3 adenylate cyclase/TolB-like protein
MAVPRTERRLAAILAADVVGYSRLMGADEEGTLARLKSHRRALIDPRIKEHHGRIVKTTGDGMLVEFASVVDAVRCAVEVQRGMAERNADVPQDRRIELRVGINLGDIIVDGKDIFGDGVNVAARLEALAEPGGICVSRGVRDPMLDKLGCTFEDIGEQSVKNIARPVHAFRVGFEGVELAVPGPAAPRRKRLAAIVVSGLALLAIMGGAMWFVTKSEVAPGAPRLSMVVLPFVNLSGDPAQEYFADGITENLTSDLSQIPGSFVIARGSAFTYKGKPVDARQVGRDLGVRYIVEGSVQRIGTAIRVNAQLIDATSGAQLWTDRFEGDLAKFSVLDDAVIARVTQSLSAELPEAEAHRSLRERPNNPDAMDYLFRAQAIHNRAPATKADWAEMRRLAENALRLDPQNNDALILMAAADVAPVLDALSDNRADQLHRAEEEIDSALHAVPGNWLAHYTKCQVLRAQKRPAEAIAECEVALWLHPNEVAIYVRIGLLKSLVGHPEETIKYMEEAQKRSPKDPAIHRFAGLAHLWLGQTDAAIADLQKAATGRAGSGIVSLYLTCAYSLAGRDADASAAYADTNRLLPNFTIAKWRDNATSDDPAYLASRELCYDALRKLGMPEE